MFQIDHIPNRKIIDWVGPRFHNESCLSFSTVWQSYISQVLHNINTDYNIVYKMYTEA